MLRWLASILGGNSNNAMERAAGEPDPNAQPKKDDDAPVVSGGEGDLSADKNPLKYFYDYLEAKKDQFNALIDAWDKHSKNILDLADTKPCSEEHERCVLETDAKAQSIFQLIKEKFKQAFESEDAYFKQKLAETETDVATMKAHIDDLIKKYRTCTDEQERREAAIHMARAQMYLLRELQDYMQCITQSFKGAIDAEKKAEIVIKALIGMLAKLVLITPIKYLPLADLPVNDLLPNLGETYQNFLDRKSEFEQLGSRLMIDEVMAENDKAEQVALDAEKTGKTASNSGSPVVAKLRASKELFKPLQSTIAGQVVAGVLNGANNNNASELRASPRK